MSQLIARWRCCDREIQGDFFFSLPPLRGKVSRGVSRVTDGGPSPHDRSHRQYRPASRKIRDSKSETRESLEIRTSGFASHHAQSAHPSCGLLHQARPPIALSGKRNRRNTVQAAPGAEIASPQAASAEASTTIVFRPSSCCDAVRAHVPSTSRAPIRPPREVRGVHLPPQGGKAKKVGRSFRVSLLLVSQLIATSCCRDREFRARTLFFSLPPCGEGGTRRQPRDELGAVRRPPRASRPSSTSSKA